MNSPKNLPSLEFLPNNSLFYYLKILRFNTISFKCANPSVKYVYVCDSNVHAQSHTTP